MLLLQQWCGYLLLPTLKYQKFVICVGDGANGKGVFFDTIAAALGRKNVSNVPLARFDNAYAMFGTYGKLVNMSNENARNIEDSAESLIKEYVAGDQIVWEQKYRDAFFDYPTAKLMFATNELPKIKDVSDGIWRRLILVPFNAKFQGDKINTNLTKELQTPDELAGILNWMLEGAEILEKSGRFVEPEICKNALNKYRDESDSARMFCQELLEIDTENVCQMPCTWLHGQYQDWCKDNGFKAKNNVHFGQTLNQLYCVQKSRPYFGLKKINVYLGIKPQQDTELFEDFNKWTA
jgi:P4 family phage/plasmid primase-like protien